MKMIMISVALLALFGLSACESIPRSYQGTFASDDGQITLKIGADSVTASGQTAAGVIAGHDAIFDRVMAGAAGVYIAPSVFLDMFGEQYTDPTFPRSGWPGTKTGYSESRTKLDVYAVFSTHLEETPSIGVIEGVFHDADILYFQVDRATSDPLEVLKVRLWNQGKMMGYKIPYGPFSLAKTWAFTSGSDAQAPRDVTLRRK